jgi:hypothetical protein
LEATGAPSTVETPASTSRSTLNRNLVYQDKQSLEAKVAAARVGEKIRTAGRVSGTTPAPNPLPINPALARALSIYTSDEIQAAITHLASQRAARAEASLPDSSTVELDQKTDLVGPLGGPNENARVHDETQAVRSPSRKP